MGGRATRPGPPPGVGAHVPQLCLALTFALALAFPLPVLSQPVLRPPESANSQQPLAVPAAPVGVSGRAAPPPPRPGTGPETASGAPAGTPTTSGRPERKPDNAASSPTEPPATAAAGGNAAAPDTTDTPTPAPGGTATGDAAASPAARPKSAGARGIAASPDPGTAAPDAARPSDDAAADPVPAAVPLYQSLRESSFDHAVCRLGLRILGVEATDAPPVTDPDNRDCGIARPVEVHSIQPGLRLENPAVMRCETARQLALWMRGTVIPAARWLDGSPRIASVALGTSYACRGVVGGASTANLSEHALGNAVDIAGFGFDNGERLAIAPRGDSGNIEMAFQNAVQAGACLYFATVLGPGSNEAHDDHLHLDIKARRNGFRLCQ